ncbi:GLABROUS1 enhancer-binding protein family [Forsythia ovata]|uniref:GLABROUS1 enhancer-binding protein family n=1 Tax=Forsythia ovata TaxID=205694 RepID=A0ABD1S9W2_9LAMI
MLPGDPCSSHSDQEPEKSTDNPSEDNVHEDDPETGRDQDSETPKEETVNEQQVEADQELDQEDGDDHQEEEVEEPTVPSGQLIACGLAMNIYHENNRNFPFNNELHDFLRKSSTVEISEEELEIKYLILHAKFQKIVEEKGEGYVFDRPYCREMFSLSKQIWGTGLF